MEPTEPPKEVHPVIVVGLTLLPLLSLRIGGAFASGVGWTTVGFVMMCLSAPAGIAVFYLLAFRHVKKD